MVVVKTKVELKRALKAKEKQIRIVGPLAEKIRKNLKAKKAAKVGGGLLTAASLCALPFTGGVSALGAVAGVAALTWGELAGLLWVCGIIGLGIYGLKKDYNVSISPNGGITLVKPEK